MYTYIYVYVYICIYIYIYICVCIYICFTSTLSQVSNCDDVVPEIYLDHKFQ